MANISFSSTDKFLLDPELAPTNKILMHKKGKDISYFLPAYVRFNIK